MLDNTTNVPGPLTAATPNPNTVREVVAIVAHKIHAEQQRAQAMQIQQQMAMVMVPMPMPMSNCMAMPMASMPSQIRMPGMCRYF